MSIKANTDLFSDFDLKGTWWLPGSEEKKLRGNLTFDPDKGSRLELDGSFYNLSDTLNGRYEQPQVIVGQADTDGVFTLLKNFVVGAHGGLTDPCLSIQPAFILKNFAYSKEEDLQFWSSGVHIDGIEHWFADQRFQSDMSEDRMTATLKYIRPEDERFDIQGHEFSIKTSASLTAPLMPDFDKTGFSLSRYIELESDQYQSLWWHLDKIGDVNRLFSILFGEGCLDKKIYLFRGDEKGSRKRNHETRIDVFYKPNREKQKKAWHPRDFLFAYPLVKDRFQNILKSWFDLLSIASAPTMLFASTIRKKKSFDQFDFLAAAQALESLHRSLHGGVKLEENGYQKCIDSMLAHIPTDTDEAIKTEIYRMLTTGNEWSLRKRLKFYFSKFDSISKRLISDKNKFIHKVIEARNYYTHYDAKGKENVIEGAELFYVSEKLKILVLSEILEKIGLEKSIIENRLAEHDRWGFFLRKEVFNK